MKSRILWGALAAVLLLLAVVSQAPAWLLSEALASRSGGKLRLDEPSGTLWSGVGRLELNTPSGRSVLIERLGWSIESLPLFAGTVALKLTSGDAPAGRVEIRSDTIAAQELRLALPAAVLKALPQLENAQPEGTLQITLPDLFWAREGSRGGGEIVWREAALKASAVAVRWRGEIRAVMSAQDDTLRISTPGGAPMPFNIELKRTAQGISQRVSNGR